SHGIDSGIVDLVAPRVHPTLLYDEKSRPRSSSVNCPSGGDHETVFMQHRLGIMSFVLGFVLHVLCGLLGVILEVGSVLLFFVLVVVLHVLFCLLGITLYVGIVVLSLLLYVLHTGTTGFLQGLGCLLCLWLKVLAHLLRGALGLLDEGLGLVLQCGGCVLLRL